MKIKLFLADCDGTLTDGVYQTDEEGNIRKSFHTRDFHGMWLLSQTGVKIGIITYASDDVIVHQCRRGAKYATVMKGVKNKLEAVREAFVSGQSFEWDEICYVGDDVLDMELMKKVGLAACPSDAHHAITSLVRLHRDGFESVFPGGRGCVRDFADYVLEINQTGEGARYE